MLPSAQRLRANKDFRRIYAQGKSHVHPLAVIYTLRRIRANDSAHAACMRIGFVVSKKQGCAVIRNRIKRRLREAVRARVHTIAASTQQDIVFVARKRIYKASWPEVIDAVDELLKRTGVSLPSPGDSQQAVVKQ